MKYEVKQLTDFMWGIIDTETGEVVVETTYYGIQAIRKWFEC